MCKKQPKIQTAQRACVWRLQEDSQSLCVLLDPGCTHVGINTAQLNSGVLFHYHQIRPEPNRPSLTLKAQVNGGHAVSAPVSRNTVEAA